MSPMFLNRRLATALLWVGIFTLPGALRADAPGLGWNTPPGLAAASLVKRADADRPISLTLTLDLRDRAGADALIAAQQDPASPLYHQWILPEEFQARFGPAREDLQAAKDFLAAEGFENISQPTSTTIAAEGTVALVERTFQVWINEYVIEGRNAFANDRDPVLPPKLASKVVLVGGLDDLALVQAQHGPATPIDPGYTTGGNSFILARDNQVAYGQKAGYFDLGKKGTSGAELAIASSWDIALADVNDQLTREGGAGAGYNALTTAASGAHTISSTALG